MEKCPSPLLTTISTLLSASLRVPPRATFPSPLSTLIYDLLNSYLTPISILIFFTFSFFSLPGVDLNCQPPDSEFTSLSTTPRVLELEIALLFLCIITFFGPRPTSAKVLIYAKPKFCLGIFHWRLTK